MDRTSEFLTWSKAYGHLEQKLKKVKNTLMEYKAPSQRKKWQPRHPWITLTLEKKQHQHPVAPVQLSQKKLRSNKPWITKEREKLKGNNTILHLYDNETSTRMDEMKEICFVFWICKWVIALIVGACVLFVVFLCPIVRLIFPETHK